MKKLALLVVLLAGCESDYIGAISVDRFKLLELHNNARLEAQSPPLLMADKLNSQAQAHAEWMAKRGSLRHSNLNIGYDFVGENIAYGQSDEDAVVATWMRSAGHRRNILNKNFSHVGFGCSSNLSGRLYWCTMLGGEMKGEKGEIK